jgi:purine-nucleoside phosphorylase
MTAHNRGEKGDYAPVVLCPGDPLRAKMVAQQYMEDARLVTDVRGILGYTGLYHGSPVSVLATGMGEGSIGIYSYELYTFYDVKAIIRIGTCGGLLASVGVGDIVAAMSASTDGGYAGQYRLSGTFNPCADYPMLETAMRIAGERHIPIHAGMVFSSEYFSSYHAGGADSWKRWARMGALAQDMETYALYCNAAWTGKKALSLLTMTDNLATGKSFRDEERMPGMGRMIEVALEVSRDVS